MPRLSRRHFLGLTGTAAAALLSACTRQTTLSPLAWKAPPTQAPTPTPRGPGKLDATAALTRLLEGNQRYSAARLVHPDQTVARQQLLKSRQAPFAGVLTCADSWTAPEVVFDQGLGDLYVVRVAGNILSDILLGSLEYAVEHLALPLIVVLGHQRCEAVAAALDAVDKGAEAPGHIASLVAALRPAVMQAKPMEGDAVDNVIRVNVKLVQQQLVSSSPFLEEKLGKGALKIVGAYANLDTGAIELLG
jgi:carbonic anhydrase